ncbi:hypothetical protein BSP239C_00394 [Brevibacterium sp. 239c]|uniref:CueP family metal-binding protein n=1 Tax=Brevibacterium sp. 239c TaxID=1965356 RepID=UPI000C670AA8|nr:CueP family metal-binding protein [Brevibacterium sp. 239c]SMX69829.1 hypothetical protein BSP239C_00394 [Brevibacterium sp. 239c]
MLVTACAPASTGPVAGETGNAWLSDYDLDGLDAREVIEHLDTMPVTERPDGLIASVQPDVLLLSDEAGNESSLDLLEDEFYVSIAPYSAQTHDCFSHSLTTCLGELNNEDIDVTVTDAVILDETIRTHDNGFAGIWLPRDIDATVTVEHGDQTASTTISTAKDDPTCITTLQLT